MNEETPMGLDYTSPINVNPLDALSKNNKNIVSNNTLYTLL